LRCPFYEYLGLAGKKLTFFKAVPVVLWFVFVAKTQLRAHQLVLVVAEQCLQSAKACSLPFTLCPKKKSNQAVNGQEAERRHSQAVDPN